jgi:hypothetical protein
VGVATVGDFGEQYSNRAGLLGLFGFTAILCNLHVHRHHDDGGSKRLLNACQFYVVNGAASQRILIFTRAKG